MVAGVVSVDSVFTRFRRSRLPAGLVAPSARGPTDRIVWRASDFDSVVLARGVVWGREESVASVDVPTKVDESVLSLLVLSLMKSVAPLSLFVTDPTVSAVGVKLSLLPVTSRVSVTVDPVAPDTLIRLFLVVWKNRFVVVVGESAVVIPKRNVAGLSGASVDGGASEVRSSSWGARRVALNVFTKKVLCKSLVELGGGTVMTTAGC